MAQKNIIVLIDDLTGDELPDGTGETVRFSLDGNAYEIDVDTRTAERLRSTLASYVRSGRRVSSTGSPQPRQVRTAADPTAVRAWASAHGIPVSNRGRIAASVVAQFEAAGN